MANTTKKKLSFEEGWPILQESINKVIAKIEGSHQNQITSEEYMHIYTIVYDICEANPHHPDCQKLYQQFQKIFEDYIPSKILPTLRGKEEEKLLKELVKQWDNYKIMQRWLTRFFHYLNRFFIPIKRLPSLEQTSHLIFYKLVYGEMNDQVRDAVISMIHRNRKGEEIDHDLVKSVLDIYMEMAENSKKYYEKDFEEAMLANTAQFYSQKASSWINTDSYETYMMKVEDCKKQEKDRVANYLKYGSICKLLEVVEHELLTVHASKLEEKKQH